MIALIDWLRDKNRLNDLGFIDTEIEQAILAAVTTQNIESKRRHPEDNYETTPLDYLTEKKIVEPSEIENFMKWNKPSEILRQKVSGSVTVSIPTAPHNVHYHAWKNIVGTEVRIKGQYQSTKHGDILKHLLAIRFPWFNDFRWAVYSWENKNDTEIYLKVTPRSKNERANSLYVPVIALMENNPDAIIWRNKDYIQSYYGGTGFRDGLKTEERMALALEVLDAPETLRLFDILSRKK